MSFTNDYIICLIGKSGSGKSAIVKHYSKKGYNVIESYTDRPKRYEGEEGHIFINTEDVEKYVNERIAYTYFDGYHYFATKNQYKDKGVTFYIIDPSGVDILQEEVNDAKITFIYIDVDEEVRKERMIKRIIDNNDVKDIKDLFEVERNVEKRMKYDKGAFSLVKCDYIIDNNGDFTDTLIKMDKLLINVCNIS